MNTATFFTQMENSTYTTINKEQLHEIKSSSELIYEEDTLISDFIRIFKINDLYIFQEKTPKGKILTRKFENESDAKNMVNIRLDIYEKMWNGCGCKVDYFE